MNIPFKQIDELAIYSFVLFNAFLCLLVGVGLSLNSSVVVITQALLTGYIVFRILQIGKILPIEALIFLLITSLILFTFVFKEQSSLKMVFDAYSIFVFFIFGKISQANFIGIGYNLVKITLAVSLIEVLIPSLYLKLLPIGNYYHMTRSWVANQDLDVGELTYYIGAVRPGDSYFSFIDHRLGSIFLESLSLGYFLSLAVIIWAFKKGQLTKKENFTFLIGISIACLLTDMRTAIMMFIIAILSYKFRNIFLAVPPYIYSILFVAFFFIAFHLASETSELQYRLSLTFSVLANSSLISIFGLDSLNGNFNDSGYLYLLSIYGLIPLLSIIVYFEYHFQTASSQMVKYSLSLTIIFFTIAMFFGFAFLSAKISALWLGILGSMYQNDLNEKASNA